MRAAEPDPQIQAFLGELADAPPFHELPLEEVRGMTEGAFAVEEPIRIGDVIDRTIDGPGGELPIRIYLPEGDGPFAVSVFFSGGGFVSGNLDSHDQLCRAIARDAGIAVVAVDYRLAPEHPFPAAVEDAYAATVWTAENAGEFGGDPDRLAVTGDSAGGNLAAVVALMARDRDGPDLAHQTLIYPTVSHDDHWPSLTENDGGYFITKADLDWFDELYFEHEIDTMNIYASPILAADLSGVPPATVVTGGFDPLRDEAVAYAERLAEAGVEVSHHHYDDVIHAFIQMATEPLEFDRAQEALDAVCTELRTALDVN